MGTTEVLPTDGREWRRLQALHLKQRGWHQRDIAEALGVREETISRWLARAREGGPEALSAHPAPGHPPKLAPEQKWLIPDFLWHGPEAYGFRGEVWTCARITKVIEEEFGVAYHKGHVSRLLRELCWTPQVPVTRAIQRDEEAIERWRAAVWPELRQRARRERRALVFVDEAGFYLLPGVVKTYAPRGLTPVVYEWQTRDHLSVMGGVMPAGKVYTLVRQESLTGLHSVAFLTHLLRVAGKRLLVIWDGSPIHRRTAVQEFVSGMRGHVGLEALPGYAPDLNPVEGLWQHLKHVEMRNLVCLDLEELHQEFHLAIGRVRQKPHTVQSFFDGAGLEIKKT
jgi:transposase